MTVDLELRIQVKNKTHKNKTKNKMKRAISYLVFGVFFFLLNLIHSTEECLAFILTVLRKWHWCFSICSFSIFKWRRNWLRSYHLFIVQNVAYGRMKHVAIHIYMFIEIGIGNGIRICVSAHFRRWHNSIYRSKIVWRLIQNRIRTDCYWNHNCWI